MNGLTQSSYALHSVIHWQELIIAFHSRTLSSLGEIPPPLQNKLLVKSRCASATSLNWAGRWKIIPDSILSATWLEKLRPGNMSEQMLLFQRCLFDPKTPQTLGLFCTHLGSVDEEFKTRHEAYRSVIKENNNRLSCLIVARECYKKFIVADIEETEIHLDPGYKPSYCSEAFNKHLIRVEICGWSPNNWLNQELKVYGLEVESTGSKSFLGIRKL